MVAGKTSWTPPLPEGWQEVRDPASGGVYYYNASNGASSWERPEYSSAMNQPPTGDESAQAGATSWERPEEAGPPDDGGVGGMEAAMAAKSRADKALQDCAQAAGKAATAAVATED